IAKKFKELIQKDELTIADFEGAGLERLTVQYNNDVELKYHVCQLKAAILSEAQWNSDEGDVSKARSFERHMSKSTKPHPCFSNNDSLTLWILAQKRSILLLSLSIMLRDTTKKEEDMIDFFKAGMSVVTKGNTYLDLRIKSVVRVAAKKK
ncbi:hypothetical protein Tco_1188129, partial [Tanacetum coccineum]